MVIIYYATASSDLGKGLLQLIEVNRGIIGSEKDRRNEKSPVSRQERQDRIEVWPIRWSKLKF